ncbi:MAG: alpha-2-macroglobulin, partial [Planctomycetota bacterium]
MMKITRLLCSAMLSGIVLSGAAAAAPTDDQQALRNAAMKLYRQGNYQEAYDSFRKLALDPKHVLPPAGEELSLARQCLQRLNRINEVDGLLEAVVEVHQANWRKLAAVAQTYMNVPHQGFIVAGEFRRGTKRGGQGGRMVNSFERDRIRALQLMVQALPMAKQDDNHAEVGSYLLSFAQFLLNNRGWREAWRLQYKSDLSVLPDYDPGWGYYRQASGAPVDEEGNPVYHYTPKSFEDAETDGQRWRWCLEQTMEFNPSRKNSVRRQFADFLHNQFGVQTMAYFGWRFGRMQTDDTQQDESGTYALHTLDENETIARLATGIKRFELPDEFNFIKIYQ